MKTLDPAARRALRAKAHHLHPVVAIGTQGLTPAVLHELDVNLLAHELVKLRVHADDRELRERLLEDICRELDAAAVQHLGKVLVIYRERPVEEAAPAPRQRGAAKKRPAGRVPAPTAGGRTNGRSRSSSQPATARRARSAGGQTAASTRPPRPGGKQGNAGQRDPRDAGKQATAAPRHPRPAGKQTSADPRHPRPAEGKHPPRPRRRRG